MGKASKSAVCRMLIKNLKAREAFVHANEIPLTYTLGEVLAECFCVTEQA